MASSFSDLGLELMATGENAGTWGTKTNTNLQIIEKSIAGYVEQAVTSGGTTALSITDGDTGPLQVNANGNLIIDVVNGGVLESAVDGIETLLTGIDADTDAIKTDAAAIEVLLTAANVDHAAVRPVAVLSLHATEKRPLDHQRLANEARQASCEDSQGTREEEGDGVHVHA